MNKIELQKIVNESKSKSEVCKKIGYHTNGNGFMKLKKLFDEFEIDDSILPKNLSNHTTIYPKITKVCPVCDVEFETQKGIKKEKITCSHSCSNTYFRSGTDNPNWRNDKSKTRSSVYRTTCFRFHKKKCVVCGENKIVAVHHYDENHTNNNCENLIPLCPTHHQYVHSKYKEEVIGIVNNYRDNFILTNSKKLLNI